MKEIRYVQHCSKTGPVEEVIREHGTTESGYWVVNRMIERKLADVYLAKPDYVIIATRQPAPPPWITVTGMMYIADDGRTLFHKNHIRLGAVCEPGFRFVYVDGKLELQMSEEPKEAA